METMAMLWLGVVLAVIWGVLWAMFLQWTTLGRFLALKRTWVTVVIGVGVDLLIVLLVVDFETWGRILAIVVASSVGIIARSLWNEASELKEMVNGYADAISE